MAEKYLGLMSGTSVDGIDAVMLEFGSHGMRMLGHSHRSYTTAVATRIHQLCTPGDDEITRLGELDHHLGLEFAQAAIELVDSLGLTAAEISAIGSHGQTVRHQPPPEAQAAFTLQLGDPNIIAERTGVTTVADFRRRDMAAGGQGAPLAPAFHCAAFSSDSERRTVLNIGGIANITDLRSGRGFDTGPGNTLLDGWIKRNKGLDFDDQGCWSSTGTVDNVLLQQLLIHPYFSQTPPKSTGREAFNLRWLDSQLANGAVVAPVNVQATLLELTAQTISAAMRLHAADCEALYVCGGGSNNRALMQRLQELANYRVRTTAELGIEPQHVEAAAFAWLARQTMLRLPGNKPAATGALREVILGGIYPA